MLEHSSELALVQSLYANNMRCPPSGPGIPVRTEDLPLRYVSWAPRSSLPDVLWKDPGWLFVWGNSPNIM